MKHIRLGFTECTLLFIYYIENILYVKDKNEYLEPTKKNLFNWLYTTSGYYDKTIKGNSFGEFSLDAGETYIYNEYMASLLKYTKNCDIFTPLFHRIEDCIHSEYRDSFIKYINPKKIDTSTQNIMYQTISNKRVLIVSSFAELVKSQYDSGNCKKIYPNFPNILTVVTYTTPYTFFNSGNDANILETMTKIIQDIEKYKDEFDAAVIAVGAYTGLIAGHISDNMKKDTCCVGGDIQGYFGIASERTKNYHRKYNLPYPRQECWIMNIPEEYKPKDYMKIENGCYW